MFDWDDEEIADIIWGVANEADDHIVPYPEKREKKPLPLTVDSRKKELNGEAANSKAAKQKMHVTQSNSYGESNDSSLLTASKTDQNGIAKKAELQGGPENSQSQNEDKELDELVDNSWDNVGSFDDLDRIFSNDDLVGHPSLGSIDELWSSRDMTNDTEKSSSLALDSTSLGFGSLGTTSGWLEINFEHLQNEYPLFTPGYADSTSITEKSLCASSDPVEHAVGTGTRTLNEKNGSKNKARHGHKMDKAIDNRLPPGVYSSCPSPAVQAQHFDGQFAPATMQNCPPSVLSQQRLPLESGLLLHDHCSRPNAAGYAHKNFIEKYTAVPLLQPTNSEYQSGVSSSEACPGDLDSFDKSSETSSKPLSMTPQEKIEKLRWRQQIRAVLAIQKQQQQLSHQVSAADCSMLLTSPQEDQILSKERIRVLLGENLSTPCSDLNFPIKWDESSTTSMEVDGHTVEDTVLYQLQDVAEKLDIMIRRCIRDSLFRLAHCTMQRHQASDMGSTNRSSAYEPDASKEDINSCDRYAGLPNVETETNHIDRAVALLLFHQPFKLSMMPIERQESSTSTKVPLEQETDLSSLLAKRSQDHHNPFPDGLNFGHPFSEDHQDDILQEILETQMKMNQGVKEKMEHVD
ncbi:hypothetical protein Ancab_005762 [Ancistrocladus abbreviatus]